MPYDYSSTHGVFEKTSLNTHKNGGQVYMDDANTW
jgi:glycine cleavage system protein P-like pyridoxal-binding family